MQRKEPTHTARDSARTLVCMAPAVITEGKTPGFVVLFREQKDTLYKTKTPQLSSKVSIGNIYKNVAYINTFVTFMQLSSDVTGEKLAGKVLFKPEPKWNCTK